MMSDLPGDMIKQSFFAPGHTIRSIRYSLTPRGLSSSPSILLPTGSSSLEKASGWILDPAPAAGIIPHMPPPSPAGRIPLSFRTRLPPHSRDCLRCPGDIQGPFRRRIEERMRRRGHGRGEVDIPGPGKVPGIERAAEHKPLLRKASGGLYKQFCQRTLPVLSKCPEV